MKCSCLFACLAFAIGAASTLDANPENKIALVNGTLINPGTSVMSRADP